MKRILHLQLFFISIRKLLSLKFHYTKIPNSKTIITSVLSVSGFSERIKSKASWTPAGSTNGMPQNI